MEICDNGVQGSAEASGDDKRIMLGSWTDAAFIF